MVDLSVNLAGMKMDNPIVPASGTFGFGNEFKDFYDINILGSFSFKGTTKDARFGNPTPRIAECKNGMINAVGLQNPGVHHVIEHELPEMKKYFHKPVIANVSGFSVEDYAYPCELLDSNRKYCFTAETAHCVGDNRFSAFNVNSHTKHSINKANTVRTCFLASLCNRYNIRYIW